MTKNNYQADSIKVLKGLDAVRKRPGMYIGGVENRALHHLKNEFIDNAVDEVVAGHASEINVKLNGDNELEITDNGRGIPIDSHPKFPNKSALEIILTTLHAGGKFDKDSYKVSGGLHGVGVSCVNALSEKLVATVHRDGKIWEQEYSKGKSLEPVKEVGKSDKTGTIVTFLPDKTIFQDINTYSYDILANRLRELSFLKNLSHPNISQLKNKKQIPKLVQCQQKVLKQGRKTKNLTIL